jgi:hypothetical protein
MSLIMLSLTGNNPVMLQSSKRRLGRHKFQEQLFFDHTRDTQGRSQLLSFR